ncbi:MAG: hypothetical protein LIR50_02575 [Bacillota bacterium]|nr:hypothetical protein [Bacillota bacterium]
MNKEIYGIIFIECQTNNEVKFMGLTKISTISVIFFTLSAIYFSYEEFKDDKNDNAAKKFKKILIYGVIIIILSVFTIAKNERGY